MATFGTVGDFLRGKINYNRFGVRNFEPIGSAISAVFGGSVHSAGKLSGSGNTNSLETEESAFRKFFGHGIRSATEKMGENGEKLGTIYFKLE